MTTDRECEVCSECRGRGWGVADGDGEDAPDGYRIEACACGRFPFPGGGLDDGAALVAATTWALERLEQWDKPITMAEEMAIIEGVIRGYAGVQP